MGISQIWNKNIFDRIFQATTPKYQKRKNVLGSKLKKLEANTNFIKNSEYMDCRNKIDKIHEQKISDIRIRSKCNWYEYGERSSKSRAAQSTIWNVTKDKKILTCHKGIYQELLTFMKTYFQKILM